MYKLSAEDIRELLAAKSNTIIGLLEEDEVTPELIKAVGQLVWELSALVDTYEKLYSGTQSNA